jgi:hypothetical protein
MKDNILLNILSKFEVKFARIIFCRIDKFSNILNNFTGGGNKNNIPSPIDIKKIIQKAGPKKVGLVGTALTDWRNLRPFLNWLHNQKIKFSLSSMR